MRRRIVSRATGSYARIRAAQFRSKRLRAAVGAFAWTGTDAALRIVTGLVLAANPGSFSLTGQAASLLRTRKLAAEAGSFALTGQPATMFRGKRVGADPGSFALSGQAASLLKSRKVAADAGAFALTGQAATLTKSSSAPAIVNSATTNGTGATININMPASVTAGAKLGFFFGCSGNETVATPSGWTLVAHATSGGTAGTDRRLYYFEKTGGAVGTEGGTTVALTASGTTGSFWGISLQVSGSASGTLSATSTGTGTNPDGPNLNPGSSASTLWLSAANKRESVDASGAPSGYAGLLVARNSNMSGMVASKTATASSEDPGAFSGFSASDNWAAITLGFRA